MIGYHFTKNCFYISATLFVLAWPLVSKVHLIDPKNFNADDLKKITDAVAADKTDEYQVSASEDDGYVSNGQFQNLDGDLLKVGSSVFSQLPYYLSGLVTTEL